MKFTNRWISNNTLLNNQWVNGEMKGEIRKYLVVSENKNTTYQSSGGAAKAAHRRKFVAANVYSKKEARHLVNNPAFYLKELEKKESNRRNNED